jgi:cyanate permease
MAFLLVSCVFIGMWSSNVWAITQTLAGPHAAGKWSAVQNGIGNLAGVTAPWLTGWVVGRTGHFSVAFVVTALVALTGSAIYAFGIGPVERVSFRRLS